MNTKLGAVLAVMIVGWVVAIGLVVVVLSQGTAPTEAEERTQLLRSIDQRLASMNAPMWTASGDGTWLSTRDGASPALKAVIDAFGRCLAPVGYGYSVNGDSGEQMSAWIQESAWRAIVANPDLNNAAYWGSLLPEYGCSTTSIEW